MQEELATLQKLYNTLIEFIVNYSFQVVGAMIILVVGFFVARWLGNSANNLCTRKNLDVTLSRFFGNVIKTLVMIFVIIITMGKFGISIAPFIAALGALAFGSTFAFQGPLSNFGAGLVIILTRPFVVGNTITIQGVFGIVEEITLTTTKLSTEDGEQITIPNKQIIGEVLHNSFANRVVEGSIGIAYHDNPELAIEVIRKTLDSFPQVAGDPTPQVGIEAFADSAIAIGMRYWVPTHQYFQTLYQVNQLVYQNLLAAGITIPFPQQDVYIKSMPKNS
ncbi:MAG: mechanosensitive ion channel family protein [Deltaproteobacteria bacterium]|nr:mechanosensitive ion channel family protein [Candidatus Anaeroferrophillus wilburensis]MBN2889367.1 mechanosensitive ion channel family protein [Deltaproteobacteria bacterium]